MTFNLLEVRDVAKLYYPFEPQIMEEGFNILVDDRWWLNGQGQGLTTAADYKAAKMSSDLSQRILHMKLFPIMCLATLGLYRWSGPNSGKFLLLRSILSVTTCCFNYRMITDSIEVPVQSTNKGSENSFVSRSRLESNYYKVMSPGIFGVVFSVFNLPRATSFVLLESVFYGLLSRRVYLGNKDDTNEGSAKSEKMENSDASSSALISRLISELETLRLCWHVENKFFKDCIVDPVIILMRNAYQRGRLPRSTLTVYYGYNRRVMNLGATRISRILGSDEVQTLLCERLGGNIEADIELAPSRKPSLVATEGVLEVRSFWQKYVEHSWSAGYIRRTPGTEFRAYFPIVSRKTGKRALLVCEGEAYGMSHLDCMQIFHAFHRLRDLSPDIPNSMRDKDIQFGPPPNGLLGASQTGSLVGFASWQGKSGSISDNALYFIQTRDTEGKATVTANVLGHGGANWKMTKLGIVHWNPLKPYPEPPYLDAWEIDHAKKTGVTQLKKLKSNAPMLDKKDHLIPRPSLRAAHFRRELSLGPHPTSEIEWLSLENGATGVELKRPPDQAHGQS